MRVLGIFAAVSSYLAAGASAAVGEWQLALAWFCQGLCWAAVVFSGGK